MNLKPTHRLLATIATLTVICVIIVAGLSRSTGQSKRDPAPTDPLAALSQEVVLRSGIPAEVPLPWEEQGAFKNAVAMSNTPIRMAAFRAILPDPVASERENIALAARSLAGTVVPSGATFSQNQTLGPYTAEKGYLPGPNYSGGTVTVGVGGGVCKISTLLYNLTILSDLPIVSRRPHSMLVPYVPAGQDATVTYAGGIDYRFQNDTAGPLLIWGEMIGDTVLMAFYGTKAPPTVEWKHDVISREDPTTETRHNPDLEPGTSRVIFEGFEGITVHSRALVTDKDGKQRTRDLGVSSYQMAPRVEECGP